MNEERIVRRSVTELRRGKTDWARVDRLTDKEIEAAVRADPDAPPLLDGEWFRRARIVWPKTKVPVSLRLDPDVLQWFKLQGPRYQTRMNAVLRAFVDAHRRPMTRAARAKRIVVAKRQNKPRTRQ